MSNTETVQNKYRENWLEVLEGYAFGYFKASEEDHAREYLATIITAKAELFEKLNRASAAVQYELAQTLDKVAEELMDELGY